MLHAFNGTLTHHSNSGNNSHTPWTWSLWREWRALGSPWVPYKSPASPRTCEGESKRTGPVKMGIAQRSVIPGNNGPTTGQPTDTTFSKASIYKWSFIQCARSSLFTKQHSFLSPTCLLLSVYHHLLWPQQQQQPIKDQLIDTNKWWRMYQHLLLLLQIQQHS